MVLRPFLNFYGPLWLLRRYSQSTSSGVRLFKYPKLLGSSAIIGTYFGILYLTDREEVSEYYKDTIDATVIRRLPLNTVSRVMGWCAEARVPQVLRSPLYGTYARVYGCVLEEMENTTLDSYPSFADFFSRKLFKGCRPIDTKAELISPVDGEVLYVGPVSHNKPVLQQVKGTHYDLEEFLGSIGKGSDGSVRQLHQCVIYLSPGDYHRFHNPTDWRITLRRHFPGRLISVRPKTAARLPGLFSLNERVAYLGQWSYGLMTMTAVGAFGVGGIRVNCDASLNTNITKDNPSRFRKITDTEYKAPYRQVTFPEGGIGLSKGEELGQFRIGSTIVLVFEAPVEKVNWTVKIGDRVKLGQALLKNL